MRPSPITNHEEVGPLGAPPIMVGFSYDFRSGEPEFYVHSDKSYDGLGDSIADEIEQMLLKFSRSSQERMAMVMINIHEPDITDTERLINDTRELLGKLRTVPSNTFMGPESTYNLTGNAS